MRPNGSKCKSMTTSAVIAAASPATDQSIARPQGAGCDVGAFESE